MSKTVIRNFKFKNICLHFINFTLQKACSFTCFNSTFTKFVRNVKRGDLEMVRVLNVAEKNDAAKSLAEIMANGRYRRREGFSRFNKIYEFEYSLFNQRCFMVMTSVSGHLLNLEFVGAYKKWQACNPVALFDTPVIMYCPDEYADIKRTLEREIRTCCHLIIWTDCDREGENIGFEIIDVCKKVKPNIQVLRARFSEITSQAVTNAFQNLGPPDQRANDAVNVRRELDLRIGAAFTRFQTLRLQKVFPEILHDQLISYGSCQFPTLGFVVERYKQVQAFVPEAFWKIKVTHKKQDLLAEFSWFRVRLFDHTACLVLYQMCLENPTATVVDVKSKSKSKWRPLPLDTVELEKLASRKLHLNAKDTISIAEKLYTSGYISYPRTETNFFPKDFDLTSLVQMQVQDSQWGAFAGSILQQGPNPRQGHKTDNAHPPIHPTKYTNTLQGNEQRLYEFITRHFLACLSQDAQGQETIVEIEINGEKFALNGLIIIARNYLDVYPYDKWNAKVIPEYTPGENFQPLSIEMTDGETSPPALLTEADLIALMEKHEIGTDATHAEHIETIKSRMYVGLNNEKRFIPGELGMGLVEGYDLMGFEMSKPHLRAELEADLKRICEGTRNPQDVLDEQIKKYKEVFIKAADQANKIDEALSQYLGAAHTYPEDAVITAAPQAVRKCPKCCGSDIVIRKKKDGKGFYLGCLSYPHCNAVIWLPDCVEHVELDESLCQECQPEAVNKLKFKFRKGSLAPYYPDEYVGCLGGCDNNFLNMLDVRPIIAGGNSHGHQSVGIGSNSFSNQQIVNSSSSSSDYGYNSFRSAYHSQFTLSHQNQQESPARHPLRTVNQVFPHASENNAHDVVCHCGDSAVMLTVRKEGANSGRQFYKCSRPPPNQCNFFLWADGGTPSYPTQSSLQRSFSDSGVNNSSNTSHRSVKCNCPRSAKLLKVLKEGPNTGRQFYTCPKPRDQGCNFFQWADEIRLHSSPSLPSRPGNFSTGQPQRKISRTSSEGGIRKRKCGICGQEGHNRKSCPQNR